MLHPHHISWEGQPWKGGQKICWAKPLILQNKEGDKENRHTLGHRAKGRINARPVFQATVSSKLLCKGQDGQSRSSVPPLPLSFKPLRT